MKSKDSPKPQRQRKVDKGLFLLIKIALAAILLYLLFTRGAINLESLRPLTQHPAAVVIAATSILSSVVLAAIRWFVILGVLGLRLPLLSLVHIQNIATFAGQFLLGTASSDAVRGVYVWRALRGRTARIALSILADRALAMVVLFLIGAFLIVAAWDRIAMVPQLKLLALSLVIVLGMMLLLTPLFFLAPAFLLRLQQLAASRPRLEQLIGQCREMVLAFRHNLSAGFLVLFLAALGQMGSLFGLTVLASVLDIGNLGSLDTMLAGLFALLASMLPITPGGLGVGEAAFNQICHWLEPSHTHAAYASIFLAYRAVSMLVLIVGPISFLLHKPEAESGPAK